MVREETAPLRPRLQTWKNMRTASTVLPAGIRGHRETGKWLTRESGTHADISAASLQINCYKQEQLQVKYSATAEFLNEKVVYNTGEDLGGRSPCQCGIVPGCQWSADQ